MGHVNRRDAAVAGVLVLAAALEAVARHHGSPGLLCFDLTGAPWLAVLAVRRSRPLLATCAIAGVSLVGAVVTPLLWPRAADGAGVWLFAMMLASYSLGAHAAGRVVVLGALLPLLVVVAADATSRAGWDRVSGIVFVTAFVGLLPTVVGRLVRLRGARLRLLREQHDRILQGRREEQECAVLAERLRTLDRLHPTLVEGLQELAASADSAEDPGAVEAAARGLLTRTREEVVALTAPADVPETPEVPRTDHPATMLETAQPWTAIAAGAVVVGLALEPSRVLDPGTPGWLVILASLVAGAPLALAWWRPVLAVGLGWVAVAAYSRALAPLDGTLSETAFALVAAFGVAALSTRRMAVVGLAVCWVGQLVGVGTDDPVGEGTLLLVCWLGGLAVNEVSRLVEQTQANNLLLAQQHSAAAGRAVVEERVRLSREIHDAIGHSLTVVALQAGAARRMQDTDPARAREVMRTVAAVARGGVASLALDDTCADIAGLLERVRVTGLPVEAELSGVDLLVPDQRLTAFRIIQEGLTNVLRHAPGSRATVTVRRTDEGVEIAVVNSAPTRAGSGAGTHRGLAGIRERMAAGVGRVTWGPREDGGFEIRAILTHAPLTAVTR